MAKKLLWMDLEMTGLDENVDKILEVAALVTDYEFNTLEEAQWVVYQSDEVLENMNDWCKKHHGDSGLTAKVKTGVPQDQVQLELIALVERHFGKKQGKEGAVLAGNSIHNDRRFIDKYLPDFAKYLHYRLVDVSSFKEIFREKYAIKVDKKNSHRAIEDIYESIAELKDYLKYVQIPEQPAKK